MKSSMPQLRLRSEYSFKRAYGSPALLAERLGELGCRAGAMVERAGTWSHVQWEAAAEAAELRAMFGAELEFALEDGRRPSAWVIAEDLARFYRLTSAPPASTTELAGVTGVVRFAGAALTDPATFDYVDINPLSRSATVRALALAERTGKPLVLTGDVHYPSPAHRRQFLAWRDDSTTSLQHVASERELRDAMSWVPSSRLDAAVRGAHEVAERVGALKLPRAPIISVPGDLRKMAAEGQEYRLKRGHIAEWTPDYAARLERELSMIEEKAYASYFIVVADMVVWAKERMLVGPARGCFLPGQEVQKALPNGSELLPIERIRPGMRVKTPSGRYERVLDSFEYDVQEQILDVELDDGRVLSLTPDHEVMTHRGWVQARNLNTEDVVCEIGNKSIALSKLCAAGWPPHLAHKALDLGFVDWGDLGALAAVRLSASKKRVKLLCTECGSAATLQMCKLFSRTTSLQGKQVCARCASSAASALPECRKTNSAAQKIAQSRPEQKALNARQVSKAQRAKHAPKYSLEFKNPSWRRAFLDLFHNACSDCTSGSDLLIHHIDKSKNQCSDFGNVIVLCRGCHTRFHNLERYQPATAAELQATYSTISANKGNSDAAHQVHQITALLRQGL